MRLMMFKLNFQIFTVYKRLKEGWVGLCLASLNVFSLSNYFPLKTIKKLSIGFLNYYFSVMWPCCHPIACSCWRTHSSTSIKLPLLFNQPTSFVINSFSLFPNNANVIKPFPFSLCNYYYIICFFKFCHFFYFVPIRFNWFKI